MEEKLQKIYPTYYNLLIFLKEFIKLNLNTHTMIKNVKLVELHRKYTTAFLNAQTLKRFNRIQIFMF